MKDKEIFEKSKRVWEENLTKFPQTFLHYPDENLVRILSGRYVDVPKPPAKFMDHGFGHGNTLMYALQKGYDCYGCEISNHLINEVDSLFKGMDYQADLRPIKNLDLPFPDNLFDIVVSWNVLHYNGTASAVEHTVEELHRVLKLDGVLLLSTVHPDSSILKRTKDLGNNSHLIEKDSEYDNRQNLTFYINKSGDELKTLFRQFSEVKTGLSFFNLFNDDRQYASYLIYAKK